MNVYKKAARRIADDKSDVACLAIEDALNRCLNGWSASTLIFQDYFKPKIINASTFWYGKTDIPINQLARSLALLFMAEIDKDERKKKK